MYSFDSRVRYSETDENGSLSLLSMMDYLQDCSTFQSEDLNVGFAHLAEKHCAWWVYSWNIEILSMPELGSRIRIATWPYRFRGVFGYRNFVIRDEEGRDLIRADSVWFFYNVEKHCPARPDNEDVVPYGMEERLPMPEMPRKMRLPDEMEEMPGILVMRHHLDTNRHVNNAQYIEMARESVPAAFRLGGVWAEYRKMAVLGDTLIPFRAKTDEGWLVSLRKSDGQVCVNVLLREKNSGKQGGEI